EAARVLRRPLEGHRKPPAVDGGQRNGREVPVGSCVDLDRQTRAVGIVAIAHAASEAGMVRPGPRGRGDVQRGDRRMARAQSAGVILYRRRQGRVEVLLAHPGGPFWSKKDSAAWSIPKGEFDESETPETAARRQVEEEDAGALAAATTHS